MPHGAVNKEMDMKSGFRPAFTGLAATLILADRTGRSLGKHYAGPTWDSLDGCSVVGEVKARDDGPDARAMPWVLLSAKSTSGRGVFNQTKSVQRVHTVGGGPPSNACASGNAGQVARVPYTATYYFYRASAY